MGAFGNQTPQDGLLVILDQGGSPQGSVPAHTYPAHLSITLLHGQQQRHQSVDQLFLHGRGAG